MRDVKATLHAMFSDLDARLRKAEVGSPEALKCAAEVERLATLTAFVASRERDTFEPAKDAKP